MVRVSYLVCLRKPQTVKVCWDLGNQACGEQVTRAEGEDPRYVVQDVSQDQEPGVRELVLTSKEDPRSGSHSESQGAHSESGCWENLREQGQQQGEGESHD